MEEFILDVVEYIDYIPKILVYMVISVSSVLQQWFPPYPGDTFAAVAGFLSRLAQYGVIPMFLNFWLSTVLSSVGLFELGVAAGKKVLKHRGVVRFFPLDTQAKTRNTVGKLGSWTFLLCKFLPGINSVALLMGGTLGFRRHKAYIGIIASTLIHNLIFFVAGWVLGDNMDRILGFIKTYTTITFVLLGVVVAIIIAWLIMRCRKKTKKLENCGEDD